MIKVIYNIFRGLIRIFARILLFVICKLIYFICGEWNKGVTIRKIKRIRFFTKLKLDAWRYMPRSMKFLGFDKYLIYVNKKFGYGM